MKRLKDKVAMITGASSGFGRAMAIRFSEEGAKVVCADIKPTPPEHEPTSPGINTEKLIRDAGGESIFVTCDVTKSDDVDGAVQAAVKAFGRLDIMVNNAGVFTKLGPIDALDDYDWDFTMSVNAKGVYNGCRQAVKQFLKQNSGGAIINMCSVGGLVGLPFETVYCASKGAVAQMTKTIAVDYAPYNIRVNGLCPNFAPTSMCYEGYQNETLRNSISNATPMGRWMDVKEVVGPAVFLASDEASYITGHLLVVDGGYSIK